MAPVSAIWTAVMPAATYNDDTQRQAVEDVAVQMLHTIATFTDGTQTRSVSQDPDSGNYVVTFTAP